MICFHSREMMLCWSLSHLQHCDDYGIGDLHSAVILPAMDAIKDLDDVIKVLAIRYDSVFSSFFFFTFLFVHSLVCLSVCLFMCVERFHFFLCLFPFVCLFPFARVCSRAHQSDLPGVWLCTVSSMRLWRRNISTNSCRSFMTLTAA
jgi:hypothetical protein